VVRLGFFVFFFWYLQRQQIRVSDALLPVAHSALYVADSDLGISYHAFAVLSYGLCISMSNSSLASLRSVQCAVQCETIAPFFWLLVFLVLDERVGLASPVSLTDQRMDGHCCASGDALVQHERFKITIFV